MLGPSRWVELPEHAYPIGLYQFEAAGKRGRAAGGVAALLSAISRSASYHLIGSLLGTYLNDHLAAAVAASELAKRCAGSNRGNGYGDALAQLAAEIGEDRKTLEDLMRRLGAGTDRLKVTASWSAEKLGRLKLNGRLLSYSPLSRLEEIELLALGVDGKLALWRTLERTLGDDPRLRSVDLEQLIARARSQRRRLETQRLRAAAEALGA